MCERLNYVQQDPLVSFFLSLLSVQTIFLQDNVIGQISRQDLALLRHLHYLYLQVTSTLKKQRFCCVKEGKS